MANTRKYSRHHRRGCFSCLPLTLLTLCLLTVLGLYFRHWWISNELVTPPLVSSMAPKLTKEAPSTSTVEWTRQTAPVRLPILMYHAIHNMNPSEAAQANLIVSPAVFESHIKALSDAGYYALTPEEAYKALTENIVVKNRKIVWITFDDGNADFYSQAYPILKKYQMQATNNIITGFVSEGKVSNITLAQMQEMKRGGMSFQGHTVTHPDLAASSIDKQSQELSQSKTYLDSQLKQTTIAVAYPSGKYTADTTYLAQEAGYQLGVTTNEGVATANDGLLSLKRVRILPTTTPQDLLNSLATGS